MMAFEEKEPLLNIEDYRAFPDQEACEKIHAVVMHALGEDGGKIPIDAYCFLSGFAVICFNLGKEYGARSAHTPKKKGGKR